MEAKLVGRAFKIQIKLFKLDRNLVIKITVPNKKLKKKKSGYYKRKLKIEIK